jgi:hypothetical protein
MVGVWIKGRHRCQDAVLQADGSGVIGGAVQVAGCGALGSVLPHLGVSGIASKDRDAAAASRHTSVGESPLLIGETEDG